MLSRLLDAPKEKLYRCWTEPALLEQWFAPKPWVAKAGFIPAGEPFMVAEVTFDDEGGKTRYVAKARHWNAEAKAKHEAMGFHAGWGQCADQLEALAKTL